MGSRKGLAGHAWVSGLRMDAEKMEGGGNRWYIRLQPKVKMEIPAMTRFGAEGYSFPAIFRLQSDAP